MSESDKNVKSTTDLLAAVHWAMHCQSLLCHVIAGTQMCMALPGGPANLSYITPPPQVEGATFDQVFVADITPYGAIGQTFTVPVDVNVTAIALVESGEVRPFRRCCP